MMKYMILVLFVTIVLYSNSMIPSPDIVGMNGYPNADTLRPKKAAASFILAGGKRISMAQLDSIIYRVAHETMEKYVKKRGNLDTIRR